MAPSTHRSVVLFALTIVVTYLNMVVMRLRAVASTASTGLLLLTAVGCGSEGDASAGDGTSVVTALYPLAFVAERVGGDDVTVTHLAAPGVESHDVELSPRQVGQVAGASLVLYLGGFAPAVDEAAEQNAADRLFDVSAVVELGPDAVSDHAEDDHDDHADDEADDHGDADPHFWLDPTRLGAVARALAERLAELDPADADDFRARAAALEADLDALDASYDRSLASCETTTLVTSHDAFGYVAARYGLVQLGVAGLEPDAEPSAARIAEVQETIRDTGTTTIFFEPLAGSDIADTIAADLGVESASLDPIESQPASGDYLTAMAANLEALRAGLRCS